MIYKWLWDKHPNAFVLAQYFFNNDENIRIVGGAVRDAMQGKEPDDCDMATTATPDDMLKIGHQLGLRTIPTWHEYKNKPGIEQSGGLKHGTVSFVIDGEVLEVTTLRKDINTDGRHADVEFVRDFKTDAERRDLTFNACSVDIDGKLHDYFNGYNDLKEGRICFVGDAEKRIQEDYLRILRYFRFKARFEKTNSDNRNELNIIRDNATGINNLSGERIYSEISKILSLKNGIMQFTDMNNYNVLKECGMTIYTMKDEDIKHIAETTRKPCVALGMLWSLYPEIDMEAIFQRWRMPIKDRKIITFIKENQYMKNNDFKDFRDMTMSHDKDDIYLLLESFQRTEDAKKINSMEKLVLPLTGHDIMKIGINGKDIGHYLKIAKELWLESNCTLKKDELFNELHQKKEENEKNTHFNKKIC